MNKDKDKEAQQTEDYGGPADQNEGSRGSDSGENVSGQFGEFEHTGVGTDLTVEMENTDVRSGLVKGGEEGADDVAGPAQYGGDAGSVRK